MAVLEHFSILPEAYTADPMIRALPPLAVEAIVCAIGWRIFAGALRSLKQGKVTSGFLTMLLCLVTLLDTALYAFLPARAALSLPLPVLGAMSVYCALLGESLRLHGMYDTFRIAAIGNAPYIVTVDGGGSRQARGPAGGFSNSAQRKRPVFALAERAAAGLPRGGGRVRRALDARDEAERAACVEPLGDARKRKSARVPDGVCAAAQAHCRAACQKRQRRGGLFRRGRYPPEQLRHSDRRRLFPPGTVTLGGLKVFGEESGKAHLLRRDDGPRVRKRP